MINNDKLFCDELMISEDKYDYLQRKWILKGHGLHKPHNNITEGTSKFESTR